MCRRRPKQCSLQHCTEQTQASIRIRCRTPTPMCSLQTCSSIQTTCTTETLCGSREQSCYLPVKKQGFRAEKNWARDSYTWQPPATLFLYWWPRMCTKNRARPKPLRRLGEDSKGTSDRSWLMDAASPLMALVPATCKSRLKRAKVPCFHQGITVRFADACHYVRLVPKIRIFARHGGRCT